MLLVRTRPLLTRNLVTPCGAAASDAGHGSNPRLEYAVAMGDGRSSVPTAGPRRRLRETWKSTRGI